MANETASASRRNSRAPSLRDILLSLGIGVALTGVVVALARAPVQLRFGFALLLAWGLALACGLIAFLRRQRHEAEAEYRREQVNMAERIRAADALRREVESYRRLFDRGDTGPKPRGQAKAAAAPVETTRRSTAPSPLSPPNVSSPPRPMVRMPDPAAVSAGIQVHDSLRDPLTGLFHQRYFEASLEREIHRMERRALPLGLILMEVDGWAELRDSQGQDAAEAVLRAIADLLRRRVRGGDVACRYQEGEFALILPEAPLEGVKTRAEHLRQSVKDLPAPVTLSLGAAAFPDNGLSSETLLRAVRSARDLSRAAGGDRATAAPAAAFDRRLMLPE